MRRVFASPNSYFAYADYDQKKNELFVTFRKNGHQYKYSGFTEKDFLLLDQCANVGSHLAIHVIKKFEATFETFIPLAEIEQMNTPVLKLKFNYKNLSR